MKSTGIVRKLDELGRVVLPIELRRTMDLNIHDTVEIFVEDDKIILKKYHPACIFCGDARDVTTFKGKLVCVNCLRELQVVDRSICIMTRRRAICKGLSHGK